MSGTNDSRGTTSVVKQALGEIRRLRAELEAKEAARREPIAIVGMGCRLPGGVAGPASFWDLLRAGRDAITTVPSDRWDAEALFDADPATPGRVCTREGGFLDGIDRFDAEFFGITPREAAAVDPQQRLLLEVAWEALEHAGIAPRSLMGSATGVFVGVAANDYLQQHVRAVAPGEIDAYLASGGCVSVTAGRLSYFFGLRGPSLAIDTACSASLSAVHLACQSLRAGECSAALAGGVSLMLVPELTINFSQARMLSPDGRCKTFDAAADGYVRSEGCGVVVLKRLSDAVASGDRVLAVIRGSAVNQDGRSSGLTVPNGPAQEAVIRAALESAGLEPGAVQYIEAHGTGTSLGDPIELNAIGSVFAGRPAGQPLWVGSVKTNVGHLEAAAGIAGLIKVVLALQHEEIPRQLHFQTPNPYVEWHRMPVRVPATPVAWPRGDAPRVAGVSSFGFSGTNAHLIVAEAPPAAPRETTTGPRILPLSARSPAALDALAVHFEQALAESPDAWADVCLTAAVGRDHWAHRLAVVAETSQEARSALAEYRHGRGPAMVFRSETIAEPPPIAFLFAGQGVQYPGMGRGLYEAEPVFRAVLDRCAECLASELEHPLLPVMFGDAPGHLLDQTAYTQPALFALEYGLATLWRSWGIEPDVVMGHSLGEDVAAAVAGVFSLEDGLKLVAARGRLMQALPGDGAMAAAFADAARVEAIARRSKGVVIAATNGPAHTVISGPKTEVSAAIAALEADGIRTKPVKASHAFHSSQMDPMLEDFERIAGTVGLSVPRIPVVSNVTGRLASADALTNRRYWRDHIRAAVRFDDGLATLAARGCRAFVEIGPDMTLLSMARRRVSETRASFLPSLRPGYDDRRQMAESLAALYAAGASVAWPQVTERWGARRVEAPTYPFQRQRHWFDDRRAAGTSDAMWAEAAASAEAQSGDGPLDLSIETQTERSRALDRLATTFIASALSSWRLFTRAGESHDVEDIMARCAISPIYRRLMERWCDALAAEGVLERRGDAYVATAPLPPVDPEALVADMRPLFGRDTAVFDYVARAGAMAADVVTGRESGLETLFPGGSDQLADRLYRTSPTARYLNAIVRAAVHGALGGERQLRILEIGAGTGATTAGLLPTLPASRTTYCFTDVGARFLTRARERFAAYPFLEYRLFDAEAPPAEQGLPRHGYDLVIAANVLHATRDLDDTLANVRALLAPHGILVLLEATEHPRWFDVTTGLIGGWQRFEDKWRGSHPLLTPQAWSEALAANGFDAALAFPSDDSSAAVLGQRVILARGPGGVLPRAGAAVPTRAVRSSAAVPTPAAAGISLELQELSEAERADRLVAVVRDAVVRVLGLDPGRPPDRRQRLLDLGVDSLMALEIRDILTVAVGAERRLPSTLLFEHPTIDGVAAYLERTVIAAPPRPAEAGAPSRADDTERVIAADVDALSDAEVEALINQRLERM